jgi:uncharacterized protein (TIGR00369 family)
MTQKALTPLSHGALNRCFGCGQTNRTGLRLKFFVDADHRIVCRVRVPRRFEGPPGHVHGGIIATLLDEAMSKANRQFGIIAMTRQMEVEYLKPVPLLTPLELTARYLNATGRKHHCESEVRDPSGNLLARAKGLFIALDPDTIRSFQQSDRA